jgi:hypothetical protein
MQSGEPVKRLLVSLFVASLVATTVAALPASAAEIVKARMYQSGAILATGEARGDLWISTDLAVSQAADRPNAVRSPFFYLNQAAYRYNAETGDVTDFVWSAYTEAAEFELSFPRDLSSLSASVIDATVDRCDATGDCIQTTETVSVKFDAVGPTLRFHQNAISSVSRQSRFVYESSGPYRFARATVTVGTDTFGPSTTITDANIYDIRTGYMEATLVPFGKTAPSSSGGVVTYDTSAPENGHQAGSAVRATWISTQDGITVETYVTGSSRRLNSNGTFTDEKLAFYNEQVYATDEAGNVTPLSSTFSADSRTPDSVVVDSVLRTGSMRAAALPVVTCTWTGGDVVCGDSTVSVDLSFVGFGDTTRTMDGSNAGVAGFWTETYHRTATTRQATATGTIDGQDLGPVQSGQLDQFRQGYRRVEIKPTS